MISCTVPIGSAYSSLPSEKTTSCCDAGSDMAEVLDGEVVTAIGRPGGVLSGLHGRRGALVRGQADHEAGPAAVERRLELHRAVVGLRHRAHDREPEAARAAAVARAAEE